MQRLLAVHSPFTSRYELTPLKSVQDMTLAERQAVFELAPRLDALVVQTTGEKFQPATAAALRQICRGRFFECPSMWFGGHLPDMTYFTSPRPTSTRAYHSVVLATAAAAGLTAAAAADLFRSRSTLDRRWLRANYAAQMAELVRREQGCEITISGCIAATGPRHRLFHTVNHPRGAVLRHAANQVLAALGIEPIAADADDGLSSISWPVLGAVARQFGLADDAPIRFGGYVTTLERMIENYFKLYRDEPDLLSANAGLLYPPWLKLPRSAARPVAAAAAG